MRVAILAVAVFCLLLRCDGLSLRGNVDEALNQISQEVDGIESRLSADLSTTAVGQEAKEAAKVVKELQKHPHVSEKLIDNKLDALREEMDGKLSLLEDKLTKLVQPSAAAKAPPSSAKEEAVANVESSVEKKKEAAAKVAVEAIKATKAAEEQAETEVKQVEKALADKETSAKQAPKAVPKTKSSSKNDPVSAEAEASIKKTEDILEKQANKKLRESVDAAKAATENVATMFAEADALVTKVDGLKRGESKLQGMRNALRANTPSLVEERATMHHAKNVDDDDLGDLDDIDISKYPHNRWEKQPDLDNIMGSVQSLHKKYAGY